MLKEIFKKMTTWDLLLPIADDIDDQYLNRVKQSYVYAIFAITTFGIGSVLTFYNRNRVSNMIGDAIMTASFWLFIKWTGYRFRGKIVRYALSTIFGIMLLFGIIIFVSIANRSFYEN